MSAVRRLRRRTSTGSSDELARDAVDHRLHDERGDGVADRAVLRHRRLVLEAPRGRAPRSRGSGRGRAWCAGSGRSRPRSSADTSRTGPTGARSSRRIARMVPSRFDRHLRGDAMVARVDVRLERLDAIGEELHGPAEHHRQRAGRDLVGIRVDLEPERAADVLVDHAHAMLGDAADGATGCRAACTAPGRSGRRSASRRPGRSRPARPAARGSRPCGGRCRRCRGRPRRPTGTPPPRRPISPASRARGCRPAPDG